MAKREYVEANKRWLEEKAKEEGVMALPRGIYYKVLKQGDPKGAQPSRDGLRQVLAAGHPRRLYPDIRSRTAGSGITRILEIIKIIKIRESCPAIVGSIHLPHCSCRCIFPCAC